ncbi:hypothetical protein BGZ60DRAFT_468473 [Tricladium varicosporioides]|nr:hypothetical protein BGZ60DRAFT_468473 [Hymenoscyphus varicosporioides]
MKFENIRENGGKDIIGKRLLPHVVEQFAAEDPDFIVSMIAKSSLTSSGSMEFTTISISQLAYAIDFMAHWLTSELEICEMPAQTPIAYIGLQDPRYTIIELAAMKIGHPVVIPGTRNAISNTEHILNETKCQILFCAQEILDTYQVLDKMVNGLRVIEAPSLEKMISQYPKYFPFNKSWEDVADQAAVIVHTSGSTGMPKPIYLTHRYISSMDKFSEVSIPEGRILANTTLVKPGSKLFVGTNFYHLSGLDRAFCGLFQRYTMIMGHPDRLPDGPTLREVARRVKLNGMTLPPSLCDWIPTCEESIELFKGIDHINWLGGPLAQGTGEWIISKFPNTHLWQVFGSTETYMLPMLIPVTSHWSFMEFHPSLGPTLEPLPGSDLYEVVIRRHQNLELSWSHPVFALFPELQEWRSRDLMRRCTDKGFESCWKFEGRLDDMLILSNAWKVNPLHVEMRVLGNPSLKGALVFGNGHTRCGIILEPKNEHAPAEEFVEAALQSVEEANGYVPEPARITRDMVLVASREKPFVRSSKGTTVRKLTARLYEEEIKNLYKGKDWI